MDEQTYNNDRVASLLIKTQRVNVDKMWEFQLARSNGNLGQTGQYVHDKYINISIIKAINTFSH